jgi:cell shape-determining protein MreC
MKATLTFVLLVFGIYINAQTPNIQYNPIDTTFTFSRTYTQSIKNEIEYLTKDRNLLDSLYTENKQIIRKLTIRDSLYSKEIEWYKQLDKNLREVDSRGASDKLEKPSFRHLFEIEGFSGKLFHFLAMRHFNLLEIAA